MASLLASKAAESENSDKSLCVIPGTRPDFLSWSSTTAVDGAVAGRSLLTDLIAWTTDVRSQFGA
eukprot:scaffold8386_cov13-Prasinocladus_malaysianus.AAC.1